MTNFSKIIIMVCCSLLLTQCSNAQKKSTMDNTNENTKNDNPYYKNATFWVGQVQFRQQSPGKETNLNFYYRDESSGTSIPLDNSSYKNASKPKF